MGTVLAWLTGLVAILPGFGPAAPPAWNGYAEDDYLYAAAATAGPIAALPVTDGQLVRKGEVLFVLDTSQQQAQYDAARARADAAEATLANLQTGSRQEEIDVTKAQFAKHDMECVFLSLTTVGDNTNNELVYVMKFDSLADMDAKWSAFLSDPDWIEARAASEADGPIVAKLHRRVLNPAPIEG